MEVPKNGQKVAEQKVTDRNWNQEDEAEELGTFSVANEEILNRVKKKKKRKAKHRNVGFQSDRGLGFQRLTGFIF